MVNLSTIDKNVYKSLGFKNKSIGQTMIKEVLQTKVTNYKTVPALLQHIRPRISNLVNLGLDINDKKMYKQLKSIKKISKKIDKELEEGNKNAEKIFVKWEQEFNNKFYHVSGDSCEISEKERRIIHWHRFGWSQLYYTEKVWGLFIAKLKAIRMIFKLSFLCLCCF